MLPVNFQYDWAQASFSNGTMPNKPRHGSPAISHKKWGVVYLLSLYSYERKIAWDGLQRNIVGLFVIILTLFTFEWSIASGRRTTTPSCRRMLQNSSTSSLIFLRCSSGNDWPPSWAKNGQFFSGTHAFTSTDNFGTQLPEQIQMKR